MDGRRQLEDRHFGWVTTVAGERWTIEARGGVLGFDAATGAVDGDDGTGAAEQGPQRVRRRTFDAEALVGERDYRLRHTARREAELLRDGRRVGRFTAPSGAQQPVSLGHAYDYDPPTWEAGADVTDARVGHLLASRFGVGSAGGPRRVAGGLLEAVGFPF